MEYLSLPHFHDDTAARRFLESLYWPDGAVCVHCGSKRAYRTGKPGAFRCAESTCRKDFRVTTGTVMERSHIPLHIWLKIFYLAAQNRRVMSPRRIQVDLEVTYRSALYLKKRVEEAFENAGQSNWIRED